MTEPATVIVFAEGDTRYGVRVPSFAHLRVTLRKRGAEAPWNDVHQVLRNKVESRLITTFAPDFPVNVESDRGEGFMVRLPPNTLHTELSGLVDDAYNLVLASLDKRADRDVDIRVEGIVARPGDVFGPAITATLSITNA